MEDTLELVSKENGDFANIVEPDWSEEEKHQELKQSSIMPFTNRPTSTSPSVESSFEHGLESIVENIMQYFQLGLKQSLKGLSTKPERDVLMVDFMTVESTNFTITKSPKYFSESKRDANGKGFTFKTYAPVAFRHFRDMFKIETSSFLSSFCEAPLVELSNSGASGSMFYLTSNDNFITKTVRHREAEFLQKLLPGYYLNLNQNPRTLLPKYFGLYCYKTGSKNIRMVVMNNILPSKLKIDQKYDLKGSTFNRKASADECLKISPTFKDLDFMEHYPKGIYLGLEDYNLLVKTIQRDCRVLESFQIMDYSLLLGIHKVDQTNLETRHHNDDNLQSDDFNSGNIKSYGDGITLDSLMASNDDHQDISTTLGLINRNLASQNQSDKSTNVFISGLPAINDNGDKLLLFVGIIDILQSYRLQKKLEHAWKAILYGSDSVSVHKPSFYSHRFQQFMINTVFKTIPTSPKSRRKSIQRSTNMEIK